jgi:hypothetical protein
VEQPGLANTRDTHHRRVQMMGIAAFEARLLHPAYALLGMTAKS